MEKNEIMNYKEEINKSLDSLFVNVDGLISELKQKSSEEILNGSVAEAQELLNKILPYQNFYVKLDEAKNVFNSLGGISHKDIELAKEKIENLNQEEIDKEVEGYKSNDDITSPMTFRIHILKTLIYLGGSSEETEVIELIEKEMKKHLTKKDLEIPENEKRQRWISNLYVEISTMINEGLLSNEAHKNTWEIAKKGIDYLGKYAK